jgi:hypothetical protein
VPEIAQHLQISLPAAKKLVLRATAQVKKRLESIESAEFCPEMRDLAHRSLFEKEASGLASEGETEILRAHFAHCGPCRTFLSALHERLHELGSTALLGLAVDHAGGAAIGEPIARWAGSVGEAAQSAADRVRHLAFKASGAFQPGDAGTAGALAGTGQKIAAICTAGATTATCLATGIVGPGIGVTAPPLISGHDTAPAHVREAASSPTFSSEPPATAAAASSAASEPPAGSGAKSNPAGSKSPADANKVKAQAKSPAQQSQAQFGFEGTSPSTSSTTSSSSPSTSTATASSAPASEPAPAPAPPSSPPPASSSPSGGGSSGGAAGATESFGFGG